MKDTPLDSTPAGRTTRPDASLVREFGAFLRRERKWWLWPLLVIVLIVCVIAIFGRSSSTGPFEYPIF